MDFGLNGKRALVLGASRGLGAACALELAREGAHVFAAARSTDRVAEWAGDLQVEPVSLDLTNREQVDQFAQQMADEKIDILINNCGGPPAGAALTTKSDAWKSAYEGIALPIITITQALVPGMQARGFGRVITIGSSGVISPIPNLALSNGVRGALAGWSKTLAAEVAAQGVTVNMILPGRISTDRVDELDAAKAKQTSQDIDTVRAQSRATIPAGRYGSPEEFAAVAAFLASTRASYLTGSMLRVDGGLLRNIG